MLNELNSVNLGRNKNTCSGNPTTNLDNFGISGTGTKHNYIRVKTPPVVTRSQ